MISHELKLGDIKAPRDRALQGTTWLFILETDSYAGNFVDEMGSYITGYETSAYSSPLFARTAQREEPEFCHGLLDSITKFFAEHGPPSPFGYTNGRRTHLGGLAIAFDVEPSQEQLDGMWRRAQKYMAMEFPEGVYANKPDTLLGYTLIAQEATNTCYTTFDLSL